MIGLALIWGGVGVGAVALVYLAQARERERPVPFTLPRSLVDETLEHRGPRPLEVLVNADSLFLEGGTAYFRRGGSGEVRLIPGPGVVIYHRRRGKDTGRAAVVALGPGAKWESSDTFRVPYFVVPSVSGVARLNRLDRFTWNLGGFVEAPSMRPIDAAAVDRAFIRYALSLAGAMIALGFILQ